MAAKLAGAHPTMERRRTRCTPTGSRSGTQTGHAWSRSLGPYAPRISSGRVAAGCLTLIATACGGGAPLLYSAHPLPAGGVTAGAGVSQRFALGEADSAASQAAAVTAEEVTAAESRAVARGVVAQLLVAPGLAPYLGARVGAGRDTELGFTASGRSVRVDARRAFARGKTALSLGVGFGNRIGLDTSEVTSSGAIPRVNDTNVSGVSLELPILVGYRSSANVVSLWTGLRPGLETLWGSVLFSPADAEPLETDIVARRAFIDGVVGAMVGVRPIWVGIELDMGYGWGSGRWDVPIVGSGEDAVLSSRGSGSIEGFTVTPAAVLVGRFN
ncbi:MAG: hypothetical protein JW751_06760 [Polyangiaceae bacterium]|nr:hypothetical protein [Polyangiaceae bacterium]